MRGAAVAPNPRAVLASWRAYRPDAPGANVWPGPWSAELIARVSRCPVQNVETDWPQIYLELQNNGIGAREVCAAAIGTIGIETARTFKPVREAFYISPIFAVAEEWRRRNLRYYPYYGRGYVQLTWESNYRAASEAVGIDLVANPDAALEPWVSAVNLAVYFRDRGVAAAAMRHDWPTVRRNVLGDSEGWQEIAAVAGVLLAA